MNTSNLLGTFGEGAVSQFLHSKINGVYHFSARQLGEKAQLLDFIVNLVDSRGKEYGPFFFLQVRTTAAIALPRQGIRVNFNAHEVKLVQARKVPIYLAAVQDAEGSSAEAYIVGIDAAQRVGVRVVPRLFKLSDEAVRMAIYLEVHAYFESGMKSFVSRLTRKHGAQHGYRE
jgi:hypothetical protein